MNEIKKIQPFEGGVCAASNVCQFSREKTFLFRIDLKKHGF